MHDDCGRTGAGKSALLRKYCEKYPREMLEKTTKVTVLSALIPESSDQKNLVTEILFSLGDPCYSKGLKAIQTTRLRLFLKDCQTEIIILDEFQHCIDRDNNKVLKAVSDWLKLLIENTRIPIVLMGQPESLRILDDNPQLSRRFGQREYLRPFQFNNAEEIEGFRTFLYAFDISLPLCERSNLSSTGTASRLYYASNGVVGYVHKIIEKAFENRSFFRTGASGYGYACRSI